jgi:DNA polymerase III subunit delta'
VDGFLTVGQPAAVAAVHAMVASRVPHALLLVGPPSVGKRSLALDLAAALLCTGAFGGERPCRACRACRMVEHGNHPDVHLLEPEGPGGQVGIGGKDGRRGVRDLVTELALLPVEGVARVAIIREAHRMNDDAQSALLKTLEEPPAGTTLILLADDEERLLPTVRSRCARIRLGTLASRDVEVLLGARELADPPTAARLARLAGGRPGLAVAYAAAPEAEAIRNEISRTLIDLLAEGRAARLRAARDLLARATSLAALLAPAVAPTVAAPRRRISPRAGPGAATSTAAVVLENAAEPVTAPEPTGADTQGDEPVAAKASAAERRRALALLLDAWRHVARDLALAQLGALRSVRDVALLEELERAARSIPAGAPGDALARLVRASELLDANVSPELVLDVLVLRWPRSARAA